MELAPPWRCHCWTRCCRPSPPLPRRRPTRCAASARFSFRWASGRATGRPKRWATNFEFSPILKPLEPYRKSLTVVSELCDPVDGHAVTVAAWLSGSIPKRTIAEDVHAGTTIDQVIAKKIGQDTVFPSLELATEDFTGYIGGCDPAVRLRVYEYAFVAHADRAAADGDQSARRVRAAVRHVRARAAQRQAQMQTDESILDSIKDDVADLESGLGPRDRNAAQRLSGKRARDRTAHPAGREAVATRSESAGRAHRHSGLFRRARGAAVRSAGAGL